VSDYIFGTLIITRVTTNIKELMDIELLLGTLTLLICIGIILYIGYMIEYND